MDYRGGQRPQTITPAAGELERRHDWTKAYRRFRRARAELVKLQAQMLELVDAGGAARVERGKRIRHFSVNSPSLTSS